MYAGLQGSRVCVCDLFDVRQVVRVHFDTFDVEYDADCAYDSVTLYDGANATSTVLDRLCGSDLPPGRTSAGRTLFVVFTTDENLSTGKFSFSWSFVGADETPGQRFFDGGDCLRSSICCCP